LTGKPCSSASSTCALGKMQRQQKQSRVYPVVVTQKERAAGFRNTLQSLLKALTSSRRLVQYYDEPTHGRFDGENFNFGLVDIHDRLTRRSRRLRLRSTSPHERQPRARGRTLRWRAAAPRSRLRIRTDRGSQALGRERDSSIHLGISFAPLCVLEREGDLSRLYAQDVTEDTFYRTRRARERPLRWIISINGPGQPIRARIGPVGADCR